MNKPITVTNEEFARGVVELFNGSGLPVFIARRTLEDMVNQLKGFERQQLEKDLEAWEKNQEEEKKPPEVEKE